MAGIFGKDQFGLLKVEKNGKKVGQNSVERTSVD